MACLRHVSKPRRETFATGKRSMTILRCFPQDLLGGMHTSFLSYPNIPSGWWDGASGVSAEETLGLCPSDDPGRHRVGPSHRGYALSLGSQNGHGLFCRPLHQILLCRRGAMA